VKRLSLAFVLFLAGVLVWIPSSPVIDLIVQNQEVVLGRYFARPFHDLVPADAGFVAGGVDCCCDKRQACHRNGFLHS